MGYDLAYTVYRSRYRSPAAAVTHVAADRVINEMREAQAESLSQLCEQHTGTLGKLETIRDTIEVSALAICAELNWGFARVCDYLQHQQESLRKIIEILERPLETAALELKRRAEAAYNNRWTDEAIRDFEKARDLNYADFTVYLYLGNLYFFDKENAEEALKNYVGAAKFSRPHSAEYAARSLLHISLIERCAGNHQKTYATTQEAMALAPNLLGVEYEHAVNACLAQKPDEALALLETAIRADAVLAVKAASDPDFAQVSSQVAVLIDRLRDEAKLEALQHLNLAERLCEATSRFDFNFVPSAKSTIAELKDRCGSNKYLECRKAEQESRAMREELRAKLLNNLRAVQNERTTFISRKRSELAVIEKEIIDSAASKATRDTWVCRVVFKRREI